MEKFYVTKFWSTQGIQVIDGVVYEAKAGNGKAMTYAQTKMGLLRLGSFSFRTEAAARADVRRRAAKKLAWLEKKAGEIKKLLAEIG